MQRGKTLRALIAGTSFALLCSAAQAGWQEEASAYDAGRLAKLDEAKAKGLEEADKSSSSSDLAAIHAVLDAPAVPGSADALAGTWRCRTIKLGGMTPEIIYSWFSCRISHHDGELRFAKVSGTQRMQGALYPDASGGFVYLGASSVKGEPPHHYSGTGAGAGAAATPDDQIGLLIATGSGSARIEFPYPVQESTFDVIELRR